MTRPDLTRLTRELSALDLDTQHHVGALARLMTRFPEAELPDLSGLDELDEAAFERCEAAIVASHLRQRLTSAELTALSGGDLSGDIENMMQVRTPQAVAQLLNADERHRWWSLMNAQQGSSWAVWSKWRGTLNPGLERQTLKAELGRQLHEALHQESRLNPDEPLPDDQEIRVLQAWTKQAVKLLACCPDQADHPDSTKDASAVQTAGELTPLGQLAWYLNFGRIHRLSGYIEDSLSELGLSREVKFCRMKLPHNHD